MKYLISFIFGLSIGLLLLAIIGQLSKIFLASYDPSFPAEQIWVYNMNVWNWTFLTLIIFLISLITNKKES